MHRIVKLLAWTFILFCTIAIATRWRPAAAHSAAPADVPTGDDGSWFARIKPFCNSVEVVTGIQRQPPPDGVEGAGYGAACYALAGRIDSARALIERLPPNERHLAAGIVFDIGHPVADMGDDKSAGPIMELVVEFWPNHYMALYHAGASQYQLGEYALARTNLLEFIRVYRTADGWTSNAQTMIRDIDKGVRGSPRELERLH